MSGSSGDEGSREGQCIDKRNLQDYSGESMWDNGEGTLVGVGEEDGT